MEKQIEKKACKNCIHYKMCLDSYREGVRQGENLDMGEEEYFADTCGCNFYADNRIYRKQKEGEWISVEGDVIFKCSICEAEISTSWDYENEDMFSYCPCCGAKMKGAEHEQPV